MTKPEWIEIVSADDDTVESEVLTWAGVHDLWFENSDILSGYNVVTDILEDNLYACVDKEEWDAGFPSRSGLWHRISTNNPDALRKDIRASVLELLKPPQPTERFRPPQTAEWVVPWTVSAIIDFLEGEASEADMVSGAVAGPYSKAKAQRCREAVAILTTKSPSGKEISAILEGLAKSIPWDSSFCDKVLRTMTEFPIKVTRLDSGT